MLLVTLPTTILGRPIETDFRKWMRFGLLWDSPLLESEKIALSYLNIIGEIPPEKDRPRWLEAILEFYRRGERRTPYGQPPKERLLDWKVDSPAIWADFRMHARIDLDIARLHWWEFMALFGSLPKDAQINRIMSIRAIDLSKIKDPEDRQYYEDQKRAVSWDWHETDFDPFA